LILDETKDKKTEKHMTKISYKQRINFGLRTNDKNTNKYNMKDLEGDENVPF